MEIALVRRNAEAECETDVNDDELLLRNANSNEWVVHKYGGTAVGKYPWEIARNIKEDLSNNKVSLVCSARSSDSKSQGTTTR